MHLSFKPSQIYRGTSSQAAAVELMFIVETQSGFGLKESTVTLLFVVVVHKVKCKGRMSAFTSEYFEQSELN